MHKFTVFLALLGLICTSADFGPSDDVIQLSDSDFDKKVMKSDAVWLVEFYAPWCGHCKSLEPEWKKAASALKGVVNVASVDGTVSKALASKYQIQGFPTIKLFGLDKSKPTDFNNRDAAAIIKGGLDAASAMVKARQGGKSGGKSSSGSDSKKAKTGKSDVEVLELATFDAIFDSKDIYMVEFFAPWCGHCKSLAPEWETAAADLRGSGIRLATVDATVETQLASRYGIKGFPTIKVFVPGDSTPQEYDGPRQAAGIVDWAMKKQESVGVDIEIPEITSQEEFETECLDKKKLCAIAALPHLIDGGAAGRKRYIDTLKEVAKKARSKGVAVAWFDGSAQLKATEALSLSSFPSIAFVNKGKMQFSKHTAAFDVKHILSA